MSFLLVLFRQEITCILFVISTFHQTGFPWHFFFKIPIPLSLITVWCIQNRSEQKSYILQPAGCSVDVIILCCIGTMLTCGHIIVHRDPEVCSAGPNLGCSVGLFHGQHETVHFSMLNLLRSGGFLGGQPVSLSKNWLSLMTMCFGNIWYLLFDQLVFPKGLLAALRCHSTCCKI